MLLPFLSCRITMEDAEGGGGVGNCEIPRDCQGSSASLRVELD